MLIRNLLELLKKMEEHGIESSYDRYDAQQPQCGYGKMGTLLQALPDGTV